MIPDGYLPPLRNTEDIPIHRPSVGGMGLSTPPNLPEFKPYVFGASRLVRRPVWVEAEEVEPPKPPPITPRQQRAQEMAREIRRERLIEEQIQRAAEHALRNEETAWRTAREAQRLLAELDKPEPKKKKKKKHKEAKPRPAIPSLPRGPVRPSQGWKPLVGADLEDAWALLEEEDA